MTVGPGKECWATVAVETGQVVQALVLAKSLRRVMTTRPLLIVVSHLIPEALWDAVQSEFDVVIRLDKSWTEVENLSGLLYGKLFLWSLQKWNKIVFLQSETMVVRNCDELFRKKGFCLKSYGDSDVFVVKPSQDIWRKLNDTVTNKGTVDEITLFAGVFGDDFNTLEDTYNLNVDLEHGYLARNLCEIGIVTFKGTHPMELISKPDNVKGTLESALLAMWINHLEHGVAQTLSKLDNIPLNGLKSFVEKYRTELPAAPGDSDLLDGVKDSIAIVGMSCRFPGANSLDEFWQLLLQGKDAIRHAPEGRWTAERCPVLPDDAKESTAGFLSCSVDEFDGKFFGVSPMELSFMDPQQRLTLQVAWEALEDAGIDPLSLNKTYTGVFGGSWRTDYREALQNAGMGETEFFRSYLGNSFGVITARISHCLGLTGPAISTESGCSSSIVAVDMACKSLLRGETDLSLAAGVNLLIHPFTGKTMNTVLAPDGHCKTFDANADGFGRAEGCGVLVLKRYPDAVRDGDRVWALIRGSAVVQEGASRSLGTPTKYCEAMAMSLALESAGISARDVSYVETHGTGTPVGDPLEVAAVSEVYSDQTRTSPLIIGSVKTNIGHTESCSGIAGIIKVALSLQNELIPKHLNFTSLNPMINLDAIPAEIPVEAIAWPRDANKPRIAGVSSFGITGTDAHAIVQETPEITHPKLFRGQSGSKTYAGRDLHILTLSGKSEEALDDNLKQWKQHLEQMTPADRLIDVCHTANVGRGDFPYRAAILGATSQDMLEKMKNSIIRNGSEGVENANPPICFLFTGQGSQYPLMAKALYETDLSFKMNFDKCDQVLHSKYDINIREALWGKNTSNLGRTIYSQTSIFVIEYCMLKLWESWGVKPSFVLGHSLGEFCAAVGAGILGFEDALTLVAERSRLIDALPGGKMLVLKESEERTEILMKKAFEGSKKWLDYAAVNSPEQTVVAGDEESVKDFFDFCINNKVKCTMLDSSHAFHSRHMDPILEEYGRVAKEIQYNAPTCPYISGMDGRQVDKVDSSYWVRHTRDRVRYMNAAKDILNQGCSLFLELGPQPVLSALTMINSDGVEGPTPKCFPSIRKQEEDWTCLLTTLGKLWVEGVTINWHGFDQWCSVQKRTVPFYPFQNKPYWFDIPDKGPAVFHPLCGKPVSNASALKLYTQGLELDDNSYLRDHAIGNKVIFPGAGFMEMCVVAGHAATQCTERGYFHPTAPVTLENFAIESPLGLAENEMTQMQSIVSSEEGGETKVTIYSKLILDSETFKWIKHASGIFNPYAVQTKEEEGLVEESLENIRSRVSSQIEITETYGKLAEFGLKFGPTFQTLKNMWKSPVEGKTEDGKTLQKETLFEVEVTSPPSKYIVHPVVADALFQALMFAAGPSLASKLHVPVSVQKYIVFGALEETQKCFIHCAPSNDNEMVAILYTEEGRPIAQMVGAILVDTTVAAIMGALEAQKLSLPSMYEDVWRMQVGPQERRVNLEQTFSEEAFQEPFISEMENKHNPLSTEEADYIQHSDKLYCSYMIKGLIELGYKEELNKPRLMKDLVKDLAVLPSLEGSLRYIFLELEIDGYFKSGGHESPETVNFTQIKQFPTMEETSAEIERFYPLSHALSPNETEYVSSTGRRLAPMLRGKESALSYLFPEDPSFVSAEAYYMDAMIAKSVHRMSDDYFSVLLKNCPSVIEETKGLIRILEVGAGTGSFTKSLLVHLEPYAQGYEFTYTDISPIFFETGRKVFEGSRVKVHYKILDIEKDVASQSFLPSHYDMIIANNVIHATSSIAATTRNLRNLLRPRGVILISESVRPTRGTNLTFGLLDAYWSYKDFSLRGLNCEVTEDKWTQLCHSSGFDTVALFPSYGSKFSLMACIASENTEYLPWPVEQPVEENIWLIFGNSDSRVTSFLSESLTELGKRTILIEPSSDGYQKVNENHYKIHWEGEEDMLKLFGEFKKNELEGNIYLWGLNSSQDENDNAVDKYVQPYLHLLKILIAFDHMKLFCFTKGILAIGDQDVEVPTTAPLWAMTKSFQNEQPNGVSRCIDFDSYKNDSELSTSQLQEVFSEMLTNDHEVYVAYRNNQRVVPRFVPWKSQVGVLGFPKSEKYHLVLPASNAISDLRFGAISLKSNLDDEEVEVKIKAYGLNFRDVFAVLKPSTEFEQINTLGIDWCGEVVQLGAKCSRFVAGDIVFGINLNGDALPSHVHIMEKYLVPVPGNVSFGAAATLPAVAATAYLCLVKVANLTKDDIILIHTGSGGVGLVAIQIAQSIGATIVTTAGSKRKRAYLRNLGVEHIFHSRNTNYEHEVRTALGGRGVTVVLNSLTSDGFKEASLALCEKGARFVEMSKLNTWTEEEVAAMRPDVDYTIVDLSAATDSEVVGHLAGVTELMENSVIKPIPYSRFDVSEIREALTYLQKARHIGKIVVTMPSSIEGEILMFNDRSTYLITGGLGGIGLEVCKWMASTGAKNIALVGRNPPNEKAQEEIKRLNSKGKNVFTLQYDVGNDVQCKELLEKLASEELDLPPLRGIMHAAGVISDGIYSNQSWDKYTTTYNPKVKGGWNLHKMTLNYPLEHFVMFSSAVASLGSLGQSNHASANFFLDSLANYRNSIGLPATTVNWGQWGQVGVAANIEIVGLRPFSALQGISALERAMKSQRLQTCVCDADFSIIKQVFTGNRRYIEELRTNQHEVVKELAINNEQFWNDYDSCADDASRLEVVRRFVRSMIRQILKLGKDEPLNDDENFQDLGMDSLMMIEMKNVVQSTLGNRAKVTVTSVKDCHTVNQLANKLVQLLEGEEDVPSPTREELMSLMREDMKLPEGLQLPQIPACKPSEIKTVLITGVTGNMGPYFLRDLSLRTHIEKIYCLVRDEGKIPNGAQKRMEKVLQSKGLLEQVDMSKITVLIGIVTKSKLGLSDELYEELSSSVDAVFHLAVKSNFVDEYKRNDKIQNDIRSVNVKGTKEVLQFVCNQKTKVVFHASSIVANVKIAEDFTMSESWPSEADYDEQPNTAYPISKFVCDRLMAQAVNELGLPVKVFRFPAVGGEAATGANVDYDNNQLMLRMMSYLHLGCMPALPLPFFILPVDLCCNLSLKVFFDDATPHEVYNVYNPYSHNETELVLIGEELGYKMDILEPEVFQATLAAKDDSKLIHFLKEASGNKEAQDRFLKDSPAILQAWTRNPERAFVSKKLCKILPEYPRGIPNTLDVIRHDLQYAMNSGIFEKFGI